MQWYAAIMPDRLTQAYVDARYFERNVALVQVLLDRAEIENGRQAGRSIQICPPSASLLCESLPGAVGASNGLPARDFYLPGKSARAQALEASTHNQRLLEQIPMAETERKALIGDQTALEQLAKGSSLSE
jgi:hypothetical protein